MQIPFLADSVEGRRLWRIDIDSVCLNLSNWAPAWHSTQRVKDFKIWIDSSTARLVRVVAQIPGYWGDHAEVTAENVMRRLTDERKRYVSFSDSTPAVDMLEALDNSHGSDPLKAKALTIDLVVVHFEREGYTRAVWVVTGYEIQAVRMHLPAGADGSGLGTQNRLSIVDAQSGRMRGMELLH